MRYMRERMAGDVQAAAQAEPDSAKAIVRFNRTAEVMLGTRRAAPFSAQVLPRGLSIGYSKRF